MRFLFALRFKIIYWIIKVFFDSVKSAKEPSEKFLALRAEHDEVRQHLQNLPPNDKNSFEKKLKENFYKISNEIFNDLMVSNTNILNSYINFI